MAISLTAISDEDQVRRLTRYFARLRRQGFFGKVELTVQGGHVRQIDERKTMKPDELPDE